MLVAAEEVVKAVLLEQVAQVEAQTEQTATHNQPLQPQTQVAVAVVRVVTAVRVRVAQEAKA